MFHVMLRLHCSVLLFFFEYFSTCFIYQSLLLFQESKINVGVRGIFCVVQKAESEWWKRLLKAEGKTPHYVKVDWDKWVDEDEDAGMYTFKPYYST
jgi:hypothetical protein